jgi:hypothetical protein
MLQPKQIAKIKKAFLKGLRIVDLHPKQVEIYDDTTQHKVICAGRGFGKTFLMILLAIRHAITNPGSNLCIISPTNEMNRANIWKTFKQLWDLSYNFAGLKFKGITAEFQDSKKEIVFHIPVKNKNDQVEIIDSILAYRSGHDAGRLRGQRLNFLGIDEYVEIDDKDEVWEAASGSLRAGAEVIIISTPPKDYDKFYEFCMYGQEPDKLPDWKSWECSTLENITDPELIKEVERRKKTLSDETFKREYLARFIKVTGGICKRFDRDKNVVEWDIFPNHTLCISTDFNVNCMTSILFQVLKKEDILSRYGSEIISKNIELQDEVMCVLKEWKFADEQKNIPELCENLADYLISINYKKEIQWYGDPHGNTTNVLARRDVSSDRLASYWSTIQNYFPNAYLNVDKFDPQFDRAENFNSKVKNYLGQTGVFIHKDCNELIKDIETVRWNPKIRDKFKIDKSQEKKHIGHLFDCISYACSYIWDLKEKTPGIILIDTTKFDNMVSNKWF